MDGELIARMNEAYHFGKNCGRSNTRLDVPKNELLRFAYECGFDHAREEAAHQATEEQLRDHRSALAEATSDSHVYAHLLEKANKAAK